MPRSIHRDEVQELLCRDAQIVEVLPRKEYEEEHAAGAISIPLTDLEGDSAARLSRDRPVIVYC